MQFAQLNNVTLHYQTIGDPTEKPLIVFSNSLGTDYRIWRDVVVRLAGSYAILNYDKRGHGLSDIGDAPYSMDDHIEDLAALLDHISAPPAIICGLSVGGMIAQGLARDYPERVRALVLCDTAPKIGTPESWNQRIATVESEGIEAVADGVMDVWFTAEFLAPDNSDLHGYRNMLVRQSAAGYAGTCAAIRETDLTSAAARISVPTMCVVGDQDGSTPPELVANMAKIIPGARYEVIKGAGHIPCVEQPEMLCEIIEAFAQTYNLKGPANG